MLAIEVVFKNIAVNDDSHDGHLNSPLTMVLGVNVSTQALCGARERTNRSCCRSNIDIERNGSSELHWQRLSNFEYEGENTTLTKEDVASWGQIDLDKRCPVAL